MYRPGPGVTDHQCRSSRPRENSNDALMSTIKQTAFRWSGYAAAGAVALAMLAPAHAQVLAVQPAAPAAPTSGFACSAPAEVARLSYPLRHAARRLASGEPLTIVAIGSSSTAGAGASSAAASYPSRLAAELAQRFPGHDITVLNRGVNGEETERTLARFETA